MHEYEIRIVNSDGIPSLLMVSAQLNANMAIRAARKMANGQPFEVWRGSECVYGIADDKPLPFPIRHNAA